MGKTMSIPECYCIRVPDNLVSKEYTVKRTSGVMEKGWRIGESEYDGENELTRPSASKYGRIFQSTSGNNDVWRIFTNNGKKDPNTYLYAWRRLENIEPTELNGDQEAIQQWRAEVIALFDKLEEARIAEGGEVPKNTSTV